MSVPVSVHQPALDRTLAIWLDSAPNWSSANSTQAYVVDAEHQPTDLAVGLPDRGPRSRVVGSDDSSRVVDRTSEQPKI
jgi:hypothetical protein